MPYKLLEKKHTMSGIKRRLLSKRAHEREFSFVVSVE